MGRDKLAPLTDDIKEHALILIARVNLLLTTYAPELKAHYIGISSGWRPDVINAKVPGAAKASAHKTGEAVDLKDPNRVIAQFLFNRPDILEKAGLYLEHPDYTKGWAHLQTRPTKRRVFIPY